MDARTKLAFERTYLAHERTQMAWVRTSLTLISFGFGIAQFFQHLQEQKGSEGPPIGPFAVGMIMIGIGVVSLLVANLQHRRAMEALRKECSDLPLSGAGGLAVLIMVLGIIALGVSILRHG